MDLDAAVAVARDALENCWALGSANPDDDLDDDLDDFMTVVEAIAP